jgi:8-oxo-dGTP pyrophosphatase MutT (NUDIX family)
MSLVKCRTLYNDTKYVPAETMIQRPSVYGLIVHNRQVLLARARHTGKLVLPGGGIDKGETTHAALKREVREETGIEIEVGVFLHFETDFFYYDPLDLAIHGFLFFYVCTPLTLALDPPPYPPEDELEFQLWVNFADLGAESFQTHGEITMKLLQEHAGL